MAEVPFVGYQLNSTETTFTKLEVEGYMADDPLDTAATLRTSGGQLSSKDQHFAESVVRASRAELTFMADSRRDARQLGDPHRAAHQGRRQQGPFRVIGPGISLFVKVWIARIIKKFRAIN